MKRIESKSSSPRIVVLADDFTGAAEIAAVGHRLGLRAEVADRSAPDTPAGAADSADLLVVNTDTRLIGTEPAAAIIQHAAERFKATRAALVFKKVDSVLRGPVLAEVTSLADSLGRSTVLLVPNNPSLGRVIRGGVYYVDGVPLHLTHFARDPHHPASSSEVIALLAGSAHFIGPNHRHQDLPRGVVLAEAGDAQALAGWASRIDGTVLAAGGAEFFAAAVTASGLLRSKRNRGKSECYSPRPALLIAGTAAESSREFIAQARHAGVPVLPLPANLAAERFWLKHTRGALANAPLVIVNVDGPVAGGLAAGDRIGRSFGRLAASLWQDGAFAHLLLEGGATASAVLSALGWQRLTMTCEWAPGVASLRPAGTDALVTLKPGSYHWPAELWNCLKVSVSAAV